MAGVYTGEGRDRLVGTPWTPTCSLRPRPALLTRRWPCCAGARRPAPPCSPCTSQPPAFAHSSGQQELGQRVGRARVEAAGAETYGGSANTAKGVRALREALTDLGVPRRVLAGQWLRPRPPESRRPGYHGGPAAQAVFRPARGARPAAIALSGWRGRHHPQSFPQLVGGRAGARQDRHAQWRVLSLGLRGRQVPTWWLSPSWSKATVGARSPNVRSAQVSAVNAMMRYARGTLGPAPAEQAMPTEDLEPAARPPS